MATEEFWDGVGSRWAWFKEGVNPFFEIAAGAMKAGVSAVGIPTLAQDSWVVDIRNSWNTNWRHTRYAPFDQPSWFHVAQVYDGTALRLYISGSEVGTQYGPSGTRISNQSGPLCLGGPSSSHISSGGKWKGRIGPVSFYSSALGSSRIADHASATSLSSYTSQVLSDGPSAFWTLQELSGVLGDQIGALDFSVAEGSPIYGRPGPLGARAVEFDGGTLFTAVDDNLWSAANFTMSAWILPFTEGITAARRPRVSVGILSVSA